MKRPTMTAVVTGFAVAVTCAAPDATADIWKVTGLSVAPGTVDLPDTSKVTVKCSFKMTLNEPDKDDLQVTISDNGNIKSFVNVSNGQWQGDSHKTTYSIGGGGVHAIKCALKSIDLATLKGKITDEKTVSVTVKPNTVPPGGDWPTKGTPRVNMKDQKPGNVQANPNPVPPPKP